MYGHGATFWDPWRKLRTLEREMDRLFGDITRRNAAAFPPVNIYTNADGAVVTAELPGMNPESLDVSAMQNTLTVRGERTMPEPEGGERIWHRQERTGGKFTRSIELPFRIDPDSVHARYDRGVLRVELAKPETEKPRKIAVQVS